MDLEAVCYEVGGRSGADVGCIVGFHAGLEAADPSDAWGFPGFAYDAVADRRSWRAMRNLFDEVLGPTTDD